MTELDEKKVEVITLRAELADNRVSKCKFFGKKQEKNWPKILAKPEIQMDNMGLDQTLKQLKSSLVMAQRRHEELELEKVQIIEQHKKALEEVSIEGRLSHRLYGRPSVIYN